MTAEVAVLNKSGVAIAADSAVTTGFPGKEKIFTTANKIFTLSKVEPVGIMINGHVEHFGCPWEVIIKDLRSRLGDTKFDDLKGYVDLFIKTITDQRFLSDDGQAVTVVVTALSTLGELERRIERGQDLRWRTEDIRMTLEMMATDAAARPVVEGYENVKFKPFTAKYGSIISELLEEKDEYGRQIPVRCHSLFKSVVLSALSHRLPTQFSTGVVITGYGRDNLYPPLFEMSIDGGFMGKVRLIDVQHHNIETHPDGAIITTFAQDDIVNSFLNGIDERFEIFHIGLFSHLTQLLVGEVLKEHTQYNSDERRVAEALVAKRMSSALTDFQQEIDDFSSKEFREPVLEVLRTAPKETLAELAESLVSITSLRQRVSGDLETVGGPVDVALISKGEGFIWIKRKHYFNTELNPHYARNYFREVEQWPSRR